jgi:ABC-type cobalamin/Fe3+-siderophores transport system ATPase subunit
VRIRGDNGTGKSTLLAELKAALKGRAHYVPAADSMTWHFVQTAGAADGFSSGQRQRELLEEILRETRSAVYLLDEWDANLDAANRAECNALIERLAMRARCVEVTHRAQTAQSGGPRHA